MVLTSFIIVALLGLVAAVLLTIAARVLYVPEDPKVEEVLGVLPGANCGGCGFASCESYAAAVAHDPAIAANMCTAGGADTAAAVGELTGKAVELKEPQFAFRRCEKEEGLVRPRYTYEGVNTCAAAHLLQNGPDVCGWSCIGYGDCVRACVFNAMVLKNGQVEILPANCTACGACLRACPRDILELVPVARRVMIHCSTKDKGKAVMDACKVGCIHCLKCVKTCPAKAIRHENGRIVIDHEACIAYGADCGQACVPACPRDSIRPRVALPQFSPEPVAKAAAPAETPAAAPEAQA